MQEASSNHNNNDKNHARLLFMKTPPNFQVGIDFNCWQIGPKFKGLKFIPPGIHFCYYSLLSGGSGSKEQQEKGPEIASTLSFRIGFFHNFKPGEVYILNWDEELEQFMPETDLDQIERLKLNMREFDQGMGYYPQGPTNEQPLIDTKRKWEDLSSFISGRLLQRILPGTSSTNKEDEGELILVTSSKDGDDLNLMGNISSMTSISRFSDVWLESKLKDMEKIRIATSTNETDGRSTPLQPPTSKVVERKETSPPVEDPSTYIHFTPIDLKHSYPVGSTPLQITKYSMDKSYLLSTLYPPKEGGEEVNYLGELQVSFLLFHLCHLYDGFEQWKVLVYLLCHCKEAITIQGPKKFSSFISILQLQLTEFPRDFFRDEISSSSFLEECFLSLIANIREWEEEVEEEGGVFREQEELHLRIEEFIKYVEETFDWDLRVGSGLRDLDEDEGEDAPVLVEEGQSTY